MDNTIPNTASYLYLGLTAIVTIVGVYLVSFFVRRMNLIKELQTIEEAEQDT
jgi:hypothetical protein